MDNIDFLLVSITNLFRVFIIWRFMGIFFDIKDVRPWKEIVAYGSFYISTTVVFLIFHYPLLNLAINILGLFIITFLYGENLRKKIVSVILIYIVNMACDIVAMFAFHNYTYGGTTSQYFSVVTTLLILVCEIVAEKLMKGRGRKEFIPPKGGIIVLIPTISICMEAVLILSNLEKRWLIVTQSIGILVINMLVFYVYYYLIELHQRLQNETILQQQIEAYMNQLEIIEYSEIKVRSLKHDLRHHIKELSSMALTHNAKEILNYLESMNIYIENEKEHVYSGNKDIDSLLNYLIEKANTVLEKVVVKIKIPKELNIHSFEFSVILGNLLENAIEASENSKEKYLELKLEMDRGILFINVSNSFDEKIVIKNNQIFTRKSDSTDHGYGLNNVRNMVKKCNGTMDVYYSCNIFQVNIMLYINK